MSLKHLIITISALFILTGCSDSVEKEDLNALVASSGYNLKDLKNQEFHVTKVGNNFSVDGFKDKVIIFDIFATWCPPCKASAANVAALQKKYEKEVKIIGLLIEEDKSNAYVQQFVDKYGANYSISNAKDNQTLSRAIAGATGVGQGFPIPLMVMYYKGKYINHYVGAIPEEMVESDIKMALKQ